MSKEKLLNRYKELLENGYDVKTSFLNIFKEIEETCSSLNPISEDKANEIIELGDFLLSKESGFKFSKDEKSHNIFKNIYEELKSVFRKDKDFNEECDEILCNLNVKQVRELEELYKRINSIKLDKEYKISYKDGLVYSSCFPLASTGEMPKILEFKSFLAKGLVDGAVFVCDFIDLENDSVISAGFVFENGIWHSLRESFIRSIHIRTDYAHQEFIALRRN